MQREMPGASFRAPFFRLSHAIDNRMPSHADNLRTAIQHQADWQVLP